MTSNDRPPNLAAYRHRQAPGAGKICVHCASTTHGHACKLHDGINSPTDLFPDYADPADIINERRAHAAAVYTRRWRTRGWTALVVGLMLAPFIIAATL